MIIAHAEKEAPGRSLRERQTLELNIISPIHIGTREGKITALEFIVSQGSVHLIDEEKFGRFIKERNLIDRFVQEASTGPVRMERFLRETARLSIPNELSRVVSRSIPGGEAGIQDFRPFTRDALGNIYLPGSSLKGVFRTAVLYRMLKKNHTLRDDIALKAGAGLDRMTEKKKKSYSKEWLQREHMQCFSLPGGKPGPNEDILRCLNVRDAYPAGRVTTRIIPIHFLSRNGEGRHYWSQQKDRRGQNIGRDLLIWVEAITEAKFVMEISWDYMLFGQFKKNGPSGFLPVSSLDNLLAAVGEMNRDITEHEKNFFTPLPRKMPAGTTAREILRRADTVTEDGGGKAATFLRSWYGREHGELIRLGFGSGMLSTTVNLAFPPELRQKIRDACGSDPRPGDPAPKSRRIWKKSESEFLPMGWMKMKAG